jgi:hypothetical protein
LAHLITIRFALTKSDGGDLPDISALPPEKRTADYIRSCMSFCPDFDDVEEKIEKYEIVDDGLSGIDINTGTIIGNPDPVVLFELKEPADAEGFLRGVWLSSYKLEIPGISDGSPFFFEDHNGYSSVQ